MLAGPAPVAPEANRGIADEPEREDGDGQEDEGHVVEGHEQEERNEEEAAAHGVAACAVHEYMLAMRAEDTPSPNLACSVPEFAGAAAAHSCSVGRSHVAVVASQGAVLCAGRWLQCVANGLIGMNGYEFQREGLTAARLPWPAAAVRSGNGFSVAVRRGGGAACCWCSRPRHGGDPVLPAVLLGLPAGDPIALLDAGPRGVVVVTASGLALFWRVGSLAEIASGDGLAAARIAGLSGRRMRRLACGDRVVMAETADGVLLCWRWGDKDVSQVPLPQPPKEAPAFPLRCMVANYSNFAYADAAGRVWHQWWTSSRGAATPLRVLLPDAQRAVRLAAAERQGNPDIPVFLFEGDPEPPLVVALTERGELWDCSDWRGPCRSISAAQPELRGLLPCGGSAASCILLVPHASGGKARLTLFARIAMRIGIPCDPLREVITPFVVHEVYLTGHSSDPFGNTVARD
eukprot:TRINITY_DN14952_c0_g3_i2.p1 TRINITY_DN14952_c0_g3~~TRINITY_DN14952_c0_g3_i2.p1  ORF type:complete len:489 (+),score=83.86 TRINITY_DN14952_c0_g3_i2:86-1468(+)